MDDISIDMFCLRHEYASPDWEIALDMKSVGRLSVVHVNTINVVLRHEGRHSCHSSCTVT